MCIFLDKRLNSDEERSCFDVEGPRLDLLPLADVHAGAETGVGFCAGVVSLLYSILGTCLCVDGKAEAEADAVPVPVPELEPGQEPGVGEFSFSAQLFAAVAPSPSPSAIAAVVVSSFSEKALLSS